MTFVFDSSAIIAFLWGENGADIVESLMVNSQNVCIIHAINLCEVWQLAGSYKAKLKYISIADCFCMAISHQLGGTIITADHYEFDTIAKQGIVDIAFIR